MANKIASSCRLSASAKSIPLSINENKISSVFSKHKMPLMPLPRPLRSHGFGSRFAIFNATSAACGIGIPQQSRFVHVDVTKIPSFDDYRVDSTKDPRAVSSKTEVQRKVFTYTVAFAGTVMATTTAKYAVKTLVSTLGPSAKTLALASLEVNLGGIPEGKNVVMKWRNLPLFIRHRTPEQIEVERNVSLGDLRHQQTDDERVKDPKWLICLGICTHLGCVPIADAGEFQGYYCPCHGSHYDFSGRIRKGPAPLNLEVPEYKFLDENTILVG